MKDDILCIILALFMLGTMIIIVTALHDDGYKDGQIDAINGNIKYELVTKPDKSTEWDIIIERK